ncbi:hypothetical protein FJ936_06790 [Mesorhizobium sp. B2-4-13]|uniref:hypothetical protein n=1 Tax=Mesorhizobium sp. B2-4-13 TaxID=2589936 RepID=UPI00115164C0|nr:hypothetical protein [Mesorhizobium sp. B2-4-13]TPK87048.1 hypothetical protein FJ936_06790 [Mesorhizobium sp. B2-4-13]
MAELQNFSLLIAWNDDDEEQGEFGDTVRAESFEKAERIVRARMIKSHWREHRDPAFETHNESLSGYVNGDGTYFGRVIESAPGAIWRAAELEKALRALRAVAVWNEDSDRTAFDAAMAKANSVLAEIDGL